MKEIIDKYLIKQTSYIVDLSNVDFITWNENERDMGKFLAKLHIGTKETRFMCQSSADLKQLLETWTTAKGARIDIQATELIW